MEDYLPVLRALFETTPGWVTVVVFVGLVAYLLLRNVVGTKAERILQETVRTLGDNVVRRLDRLADEVRNLSGRVEDLVGALRGGGHP